CARSYDYDYFDYW
nr:immunoglobulin heavy chain junction region [Mus musculus]